MSLVMEPLPPRPSVSREPGKQVVEFEGGSLAFDFEPSLESCTDLLVLINGYQRSRLDFRAFRKRIKSQLPQLATVALDNRGVGETRFEGDKLTIERMARDVRFLATAFEEALGLTSYAVLGISMGGMIAQCLAADNPEVRALVLVSTTAGGNLRVWPGAQQGGQQSASADEELPPESVRERTGVFKAWPTDKDSMSKRMRRYFGQRFLRESPLLFDMMVNSMLKAAGESGSERASLAQHEAGISFTGASLLPRIAAPTLIVTGSEDDIIPPANSQNLAARIPGSRVVTYPEVGHLILIEEPENFVADVASFLQG